MKRHKISNNIILNADTTGESLDVYVMDIIGEDWWTGGGVTKASVLNELKGRKIKDITLHISSPGGDVDHALAIKDMLLDTNATITAELTGLPASAATIVMAAASKIKMSSDALGLIHLASTGTYGNRNDHQKSIQTLEMVDNIIANLFAKKSGKDASVFLAEMAKDEWKTPQQLKDLGIVDEIIEKQPITNAMRAIYRNAVDKKQITLPDNYKLEDSNTIDMTDKKKGADLVLSYLKELKNQGFKLVGIDDEKPEVTTRKIQDLNASFIKNVEEAITAENTGEDTQVTNAIDYSATVTEDVNSIEMGDDTTLELLNAPYAVTADGATALEADITSATSGTATGVKVTFNEADTSLTIEITGSDVEFKTVNGSTEFTATQQNSSQSDTADNLKKQIANVNKRIAAEKKQKQTESDEVKKLKAELAAKNQELLNIKTGKSGGNSKGSDPAKVLDKKDKPDVSPGEQALLNTFDKKIGK